MDSWRVCDRCSIPREWTYDILGEVSCHECSSAYEEREPFLNLWDSVAESDEEVTDEYENYKLILATMESLAAQERGSKG